MITLIHGPAELLRAEALAKIQAAVAPDPELAALNTIRLDGRTITPAELQNACDTLPFLAERRLVIVENLLARLAGPAKRQDKTSQPGPEEIEAGGAGQPAKELRGQARTFLAYLPQVPASTQLVLLEADMAGGPGLRKVQDLARSGQAQIILCEKPRKAELPEWIRNRARLRGVKLDAGAVQDLAEFIGDDLRLVDQELLKLKDYAAGRTVTRDDVRALVPATRAANVFEIVDALGAGDGLTAGRLMHRALTVDGEPPLRLLAMIARQYRLLIQVKALQAQGARPPEIAQTLNIGEWTVPRFTGQANRHTFSRLERAMGRILAADEAIKTGRLTDHEALDILLAELIEGV